MKESDKKRILLISPCGNIPNYWLPLSLGYIKSNIISDKYNVKIIDCTFENWWTESPKLRESIINFSPHLVGVTTISPTYPESLKVLDLCKAINPNIITILGGSHATVCADEVMKNTFIDFVFRGEVELSFPVFLDEIEKAEPSLKNVKGLVFRQGGQIIKNSINIELNLDKIIRPDYRAVKLNEYLERGYRYGGFFGRNAPILLTRGCPYHCAYCLAPILGGNTLRSHSIGYAVNLVKHLYEDFSIRQFNIIDDNFTFNIDYAKEFCREIIKLNKSSYFSEQIYFSTPNGIRIQKIDEELLCLMKSAGWTDITVAPESGSIKTLEKMKKSINPDKVPLVIEKIKKAGFPVRGYFIIGYPGETESDLRATSQLIRKCKFDFFMLNRFFPIPGTPIFDEMVESGELEKKYIFDYGFSFIASIRNKQNVYVPSSLATFNFFLFAIKEYAFLFLRNPSSLFWILKFYGISRIIKILFFVKTRKNK